MSKILIIDDDPVTKLFCQRILEKQGFEVDTASDGYEAIKKAKETNYDSLLVDLVLPGMMNGIDIIKEVRSFLPNSSIIAYSGFSDADIAERVIHAGADNFLAKPFKPERLIKVMFPNKATFSSKN